MDIRVNDFRSLMNGQPYAEIMTAFTATVVRKLAVVGDTLSLDACDGEPPVILPLDTTIEFEPWFMDRGSLLFPRTAISPTAAVIPPGEWLKICAELDRIRYADGSEATVHHEQGAQ